MERFQTALSLPRPNGRDAASPIRAPSENGLHAPSPLPSPSASKIAQLAETTVGVREISKQIGRALLQLENPRSVMIVSKVQDSTLVQLTRHLAVWLATTPRPHPAKGETDGFEVYVDDKLRPHPAFADIEHAMGTARSRLRYWTPELCAQSADLVDFIITLGGDGTVLYTSWLFQKCQVPPIIPFHLGSLGFLTPFDFKDVRKVLGRVVGCDAGRGVRVNMRMRFRCTVWRSRGRTGVADGSSHTVASMLAGPDIRRAQPQQVSDSALPSLLNPHHATLRHSGTSPDGPRQPVLALQKPVPAESFMILNDLVVDRGPSPYISQLELYGDEKHLTTVQADGLVIATPTGSTAYSLSAGGSMVHPEVPAILVTPICAHTLSFRPMLLPDAMELRIVVPRNSRNTAYCSFDGRHRIELRQGDFVTVTASPFPCPTICAKSQSDDWFESLARCLRWNERVRQGAGEGEKRVAEFVGALCACDDDEEGDGGGEGSQSAGQGG
ncbi:ATP-NAD kinase-like domain-containing protein [Hyaloraphidium curvatum]|nr:ATP-NAD kinase-like domain-containing protein [Hyaloraphidium curvatum]